MLIAVLTGLIAGAISLVRLWLGNPHAVSQVLWAEDGLFPLCIHKADAWTCLTDPFAGYLLFLPRVVAWPVSWLPWEYWAIATNIAGALILALVSVIAVRILRSAGMSWFVSMAVALLPALAPMVGLEAINAVGSSYMLLLFLATLVVAFPSLSRESWKGNFLGALLLLVTALTIPSAIVLVPLILMMFARKRMVGVRALVWSAAVLVGLALQFVVAVNAEAPRYITLGSETLDAWADAVPVSILTFWPGLSLGEYSFFSNFMLSPIAITGWLAAAAILVTGLWLVVRGSDRFIGVGVLLLGGLGFGLIPSAIGYTNNRYFVVPLLLWGAALLVSLDSKIRTARPWIVTLVSAVVLLIWWPAFPASPYRSTPAPEWTSEVARIEAKCESDPSFVDRPLFTPFWPPNWGDGLTEPTHPNLPCTTVWRWLDE